MTNRKHQARALRTRAAIYRAAADYSTNGGHGTNRLLLQMAWQLEQEAAALETAPAPELPP